MNGCMSCWHRPIFPGGRPPSIFGDNELNYRVRDGNGWTLISIDTNWRQREYYHKGTVNASTFSLFSKKTCNFTPKVIIYTHIINSIAGADMKAFKIISATLGGILCAAGIAAIVLTIWANKPRGVKIDISKISN